MVVEIEHTFKVPGQDKETAEISKINPGPSEALSFMPALQINVKCDSEDNNGELFLGNQTLPEDWVSVLKYPYASSTDGIKVDHHLPIKFSGQEVLEVTSNMYSDRIKVTHKRSRTNPQMGNLPPRTVV